MKKKYLVVFTNIGGLNGNVDVTIDGPITVAMIRKIEAQIKEDRGGNPVVVNLIELASETAPQTDKEAFVELMARFGVHVEETICTDPGKGSYFEIHADGNDSFGRVRSVNHDSVPAFTFFADGAFDWIEL